MRGFVFNKTSLSPAVIYYRPCMGVTYVDGSSILRAVMSSCPFCLFIILFCLVLISNFKYKVGGKSKVRGRLQLSMIINFKHRVVIRANIF